MSSYSISTIYRQRGIAKIFFLICFMLIGISSFSQSDKKHDKLFEEAKSSYMANKISETIAICNRIISEAPDYLNAHLLLADIYKDQKLVTEEIKHLSKAEELTSDTLLFFRLGEAHYETGNYSEALRYYTKYSESKLIPEKRQFLLASKIASCRFAINAIQNPVEFDPINMGDEINSHYDEYWPTPSLDGKTLVFTRLIDDPDSFPQEDFFVAEKDSDNWQNVQAIHDINTEDNEGAQSLSADSKILFFTGCNREDGLGSCDIYFSRFQNGRWSMPQNAGVPLNSGAWEAQPSFSSDNRFIYFSSNRPGGKGKKDIWRAEFLGFSETGRPKWKEPENMGDAINTSEDEISPFIHANNRNFYFSSDGHIGMGGLDLFAAEIDPQGNVQNVKNMGYPINTHKDDMGLTISSIGETAYFSSAREADKGLDIFSFNLDRGLRPEPVSYIKAKISDKTTRQPVSASIDLVDLTYNNPKERKEQADENGEIMLCLPLSHNYSFTVSEAGYLFYSISILPKDAKTLIDPLVLNIELEPIEIGAKMDLYNIYFETDSFRILAASEPELDRLTSFLKNNQELTVEIQGHTDSTGIPERNQILSENRARSVVDYLVENGISANRLQFKGYGADIPVASNETEDGRRLNRRTTIQISGK